MSKKYDYMQMMRKYIGEIEKIRNGKDVNFRYKDSPVFESLKECFDYIVEHEVNEDASS